MSPAAVPDLPLPQPMPLEISGRTTATSVHRGNESLGGFLKFRVQGPGCQGRIVQIRSSKCTIGSAAGCTLRLHSPHVPRLACWIVRGTEKIAARRFEGALTVNGAAFELVELKPGDRLLVGNIELELLPSGPAEDTTDTRPAASLGQPGGSGPSADRTEGDDAIRAMEARLEEALRKVAQLEQESHQGFGASILAAERAEVPQLNVARMGHGERLIVRTEGQSADREVALGCQGGEFRPGGGIHCMEELGPPCRLAFTQKIVSRQHHMPSPAALPAALPPSTGFSRVPMGSMRIRTISPGAKVK